MIDKVFIIVDGLSCIGFSYKEFEVYDLFFDEVCRI